MMTGKLFQLLRAVMPLALAGGVLLALAAPASAQPCQNYAQSAVDQHAENLQLNCGFGGPRWQSDFVRHRDWCRAVGPVAAQRETDNARSRRPRDSVRRGIRRAIRRS